MESPPAGGVIERYPSLYWLWMGMNQDNEKLKADLEDIKKRLDAKEKEQTDND